MSSWRKSKPYRWLSELRLPPVLRAIGARLRSRTYGFGRTSKTRGPTHGKQLDV